MILGKGVRKGKKLKAPRYASAVATHDYITVSNIIPNKFYRGLKGFKRSIYLTIYTLKKFYYYAFLLFKVFNNLIVYYYLVKENLLKVLI